jgi:hypothetical protein
MTTARVIFCRGCFEKPDRDPEQIQLAQHGEACAACGHVTKWPRLIVTPPFRID